MSIPTKLVSLMKDYRKKLSQEKSTPHRKGKLEWKKIYLTNIYVLFMKIKI